MGAPSKSEAARIIKATYGSFKNLSEVKVDSKKDLVERIELDLSGWVYAETDGKTVFYTIRDEVESLRSEITKEDVICLMYQLKV